MNPSRNAFLQSTILVLLTLGLIPGQGMASESRLPVKFSMVQYLQHSPRTDDLHSDLGFTITYTLNNILDLGLAYRAYGANQYYNVEPFSWTGILAERTLIYTNFACLDIHPFQYHGLFFRTAAGVAGITEEQVVLYTTNYNYTWAPSALVGVGLDITAYRNLQISTQCELLYLPDYKQDLPTNPPWIFQVGLGLTVK